MDVIEIHRKKISISAPFFWGTQERVDTAPKASGCILGGTQMTYGEEPGKQKTRRRRAQELSRSCAQENAWWKWNTDRIVQLAFGRDWSCVLRLAGRAQREGAVDKEWESEPNEIGTRFAPSWRRALHKAPVDESERGQGVRGTGRRIHRTRSRAEVKALTTR